MDASCINRAILWAMRKVKVCKDIIVLCWKSCRFLFVAAKIHNLRDYFPKPSFLTERNTRFEHNHIRRSCEAFQGLKGHQRRPSIKDPRRPRKKAPIQTLLNIVVVVSMVFWVEFLLVKSDAFTQELVEWKEGNWKRRRPFKKEVQLNFKGVFVLLKTHARLLFKLFYRHRLHGKYMCPLPFLAIFISWTWYVAWHLSNGCLFYQHRKSDRCVAIWKVVISFLLEKIALFWWKR